MQDLGELLRAYVARGDEDAMEALVRATRPRLLAAVRHIGGAHDAEDAAQGAYLSLLRLSADALPREVYPWLLAAAVRIAYRRRAKARREEEIARRLMLERGGAAPAAAEAAGLDAERIRREVDRLPPVYRDPVVLHHLNGLETAEIARLLDVEPGTVRTRLHRGRALLRSRLGSPLGRLLFFLPWLARDAGASLLGGVIMSKKLALTGLILLVLLAGALVRLSRDGPVLERAPLAALPAPAPGTQAPAAAEPLPPPVEPSAIDPDLDLHGVVRDERGAPVAGAAIETVSFPWRRVQTLNIEEYDREEAGPGTRSAADGTFAIRLRRGALVRLRVRAAGFEQVEVDKAQAGERIAIALRRGVAALVFARDAAGAPAAGARLRLFTASDARDACVDRKGVTGADGRFRFDGLPPSVEVQLDVEPTRLGSPAWVAVVLPPEGAISVEVPLREGRTLRGRVYDAASGAPIPGARVGMNWTLERAAIADAAGRYELRGWTGEGMREIGCDAAEYAQATIEVGAEDEIDFALERGGAARGRVVGADGRPVAGARVSAVGSSWAGGRVQTTSDRHAATGADGSFELRGLRLGLAHLLAVVADGHGRHARLVEPAPGILDFGEIRLAAPHSIEGVLLDANDRPASRTLVRLTGPAIEGRDPYERYGTREERRTDHLGRFRFPDLEPGAYTVEAIPAGAECVSEDVVVEPGRDRRDVRMRLAAGRPLRVYVRSTAGEPVAGAFVHVTHAGGVLTGRTGADGSGLYRVEDPVSELEASVVSGPRRFLAPAAYPRVGPEDQEVTITVEEGAEIAGTVLDPDGKALPDAWIGIRPEGRTPLAALSEADGRFSATVPSGVDLEIVLEGLMRSESGGYTIDQDPPFEAKPVRAVAGTEEVTIRTTHLAFDRTIRIRAVAPDGAPLEGVRIVVGERSVEDRTGRDGRVELRGRSPRPTRVRLFLPDADNPDRYLAPGSTPVAPSDREVTIAFLRSVEIEGVCATAEGTPVANAHVSVGYGGDAGVAALSDAQGRFRIRIPADAAVPVEIGASKEGEGGEGALAAARRALPRDAGPIRLLLEPAP